MLADITKQKVAIWSPLPTAIEASLSTPETTLELLFLSVTITSRDVKVDQFHNISSVTDVNSGDGTVGSS